MSSPGTVLVGLWLLPGSPDTDWGTMLSRHPLPQPAVPWQRQRCCVLIPLSRWDFPAGDAHHPLAFLPVHCPTAAACLGTTVSSVPGDCPWSGFPGQLLSVAPCVALHGHCHKPGNAKSVVWGHPGCGRRSEVLGSSECHHPQCPSRSLYHAWCPAPSLQGASGWRAAAVAAGADGGDREGPAAV